MAPVPSERATADSWSALDRIVARVFRSPELGATLEAIVAAVVPEFADDAYLTLVDPHGEERALLRPGEPAELTLPLIADGSLVGALHLHEPRLDEWLMRAISDRCGRALSNARRFERERHVALTFQNAALVSELPDGTGYRFDAIYETGRAEALVGGDWYDAFRLPDGRFIISIGDVAGSGLEAAIAMVNVRQTVRGVAQLHADPALMIEAAERTVRSQHPDRFVTAFVGVIDPVTQRCTYANAGHPRPYVRLPDGSVIEVPGGGVPLGLGFSAKAEVQQCVLPPGAVLVLYTDGLIEATHDIVEGERRLEEALRDPALPQRERIAQHLHDVVLRGAARDDVAILAVRVESALPVQRWRFDPMWPDAAARVRDEMRAALRTAGVPASRMSDVDLMYSELVANALRHAPGTLELIVETHAEHAVLHVLDKGPGFVFSPRLPADLYSESGRGLFLVAAFAEDFNVERRPGGGSHARITIRIRKEHDRS